MTRNQFFIILGFFISISQKVVGQPIIIRYTIEKNIAEQSSHLKSDYCTKVVDNNWDHLDLSSLQTHLAGKTLISNSPGKEVALAKYKINREGAYIMMDMLGHEMLLDSSMAGDTIDLRLKPNERLKIDKKSGKYAIYLNDSIKSTKYYNISYPAKYKYMGFFDSLAYLHGDLRGGGGGYSFNEFDFHLPAYLTAISKAYADRLAFFADFVKEYKTPAKMQYYAYKEIQYCYYNDLLQPLVKWDAQLLKDYPKPLQDSISMIGKDLNNDDLFENTLFYRAVTLDYVSSGFEIGKLKSSQDNLDQNYLNKQLEYCQKNLQKFVRGYVLTWFMQKLVDNNNKGGFMEFYKAYNFNTSTPGLNQTVDSLYKITVSPSEISATEVLGFSFLSKDHQARKLSDIVNKDIILIDCWATWCIPCRNQMPALDSLIEEFHNKVQFVSISADQFTTKWDNWLRQYPVQNDNIQLLAENGFQNTFFRRLEINAIPRYILITRQGKLLNASMPYPSDRQRFINELRKYL